MRLARVLTFFWLTATLVALAWPASALPDSPFEGVDKLVHFGIFFVGAVLALLGWPDRRGLTLVALLLFAPLAEAWQGLLPTGREPNPYDAVANVLGVLAGWALVHALRPRPVAA